MQKTIASLMFCFIALFAMNASAQDAVPAADSTPAESRLALEKADAASNAAKNVRFESTKPRLPNGYGKIVNADQKKEIYTIQQDYGDIIAALKERIALLEKERNEKIGAVLTEEQRAKFPVRNKK
jgi:hypothetical protein